MHDQQYAGMGLILSNSQESVIMVASKKEFTVNEPLDIKHIVLLRGLQLCIPLDLQELIVKSDSLHMVQDIQELSESRSLPGNLIKDY